MTEFATKEEMIHSFRNHLPELLRGDPSLGDHILTVTREHFPTKVETEDRFTRMLDELARNREEQNRKWDEQKAEDRRRWDEQKAEDKRKWDEQNRKWDEQNRKWDEQNRKWDEQKAEDKRKWDEQKAEDKHKWDEQKAEDKHKWDEQKAEDKRKWEESNQRFDKLIEEMGRRFDEMDQKIERSIGGLGARWGLKSERAFRNALSAILVKSFDVEVINVNEFDDKGEVFGQPDQVELDIIIQNGLLILCELKSSMSRSDMRTFERKVRFYEKRHGRQASRKIVVSPMIEERAHQIGEALGIEMYSDSPHVPVRKP